MQQERNIFYGWWIVFATFIMLLIGVGSSFYTVSVFLGPLREAFGWSATKVSLGFTIAALLSGLLSPLIGVIIGKIGVKKVELYGTAIVGISLLLLGNIQQIWQYYALMALMATGIGSIAWVPSQTIISHWFTKKRGTAMGIIMAGLGLGGMVMILLASYLVDTAGWRWAYQVMGLITLGIVLPVVMLIVKNKPQEIGMKPDGIVSSNEEEQENLTPSLTVGQAIKGITFYLILLIALCWYFIFGGLAQHAVGMLESMTISQAATLWGLALGVSVIGRLIFGFLADRTSQQGLMILILIFTTLAMLSIYLLPYGNVIVWGFVIFYGLSIGGFASIFPLIIGNSFGIENFSKFVGLFGLFQILAMAVGTVAMGRLFDASGSYTSVINISIIFAIVAVITSLLLSFHVNSPSAKEH